MDLNFIVIILLIVYFVVSLFLKISSKIAVAISLILIATAAVFFAFGDKNSANSIARIIYYLLIVAVGLVIVECFREIKKKKNIDNDEEK